MKRTWITRGLGSLLLVACGGAGSSAEMVDASATAESVDGGRDSGARALEGGANDGGAQSFEGGSSIARDGATTPAADGGARLVDGATHAADASSADANMRCAPVLPTMRDGKYTLTLGELTFEVDARVGGRITTFSLAGHNVLTSAAVNGENWGATLWTSPQSAWNWPPPAAYDTGAYEAKLEGAAVVMTSPVTTAPYRVQVTKRFELDRAREAVHLTYVVTNRGDAAVSLAAWEISRHAGGGLTFFPSGGNVKSAVLPVEQRADITWYDSEPAQVRAEFGEKFASDGREGWVAHADQQLLLVKSFVDREPEVHAPGHGEVELYANRASTPAQAYVEVEMQGAYVMLAPSQSTTWEVWWSLARLPSGPIAVDDERLVSLARALNAREACTR